MYDDVFRIVIVQINLHYSIYIYIYFIEKANDHKRVNNSTISINCRDQIAINVHSKGCNLNHIHPIVLYTGPPDMACCNVDAKMQKLDDIKYTNYSDTRHGYKHL